jgi:octaprenyl-diphosphate synthase
MATGTASLLDVVLRPIREDLEGVEAEMDRMLSTSAPPLAALIAHVRRFSGKRLRPALALLAARMFGGVRREHLTVGAVVELIHTATLVHDDILDESAMRRQVETVNHRVGNETAVLLGDYLFATAFKEAAAMEDPFPARYLSEVVTVVCRGEILQVHHRNDADISEATYFRVIEDKTAALYAAGLRCGATLAGAGREEACALDAFGTKIGCAFQIVDDILDLVGEEASVGKSLGTDLDKAKMTLPLLRLREKAKPRDRARLRDAIRSGSAEARRALLPLLAEYGAIESARATAEAMVASARRDLERLPDGEVRRLLALAADYVLARDR